MVDTSQIAGRAMVSGFPVAAQMSVGVALSAVSFTLPVALTSTIGSIWVSVLAGILVSALTASLLVVAPRLFVFYWISLVLFQNVFTGLAASADGESIPLAVTEAKSIAAVVAFVVCAPRIWSLLKSRRAILVLALMYWFFVLANLHAITGESLAYLRNFFFPLIFLAVAVVLATRFGSDESIRVSRDVTYFSAFVLAAGAALEWTVGTSAWRAFFNTGQNETLNSLAEKTRIFGIELPRVGGFLFEPINQGYLAASVIVSLLLLMALTDVVSNRWLFALACFCATLALVLAVAKNGVLMFGLLLVALTLVLLRSRGWLVVAITSIAGLAVTLFYATLIIGPGYLLHAVTDPVGSIGYDSSTFHVAGLVSGIGRSLLAFPFGYGVGVGGNFAKLDRPDAPRSEMVGLTATGAESAWGVLAFQAGILALALFLALIAKVGRRLGDASIVLLAVWLAAAMFSEAFFGPISAAILILNAGLLMGADAGRLRTRLVLSYIGAVRRRAPSAGAAETAGHRQG